MNKYEGQKLLYQDKSFKPYSDYEYKIIAVKREKRKKDRIKYHKKALKIKKTY